MRNPLRRIDGDRKSDPRRRARRCVNRRIDSDHLPVRVDQWSAGIPAVDGRIRLNRLVDKSALACLHRAAHRAYHSGCQRTLKSKRITDRQNFLPYLQ